MREDLLDAQAAVDWAEAQLKTFISRLSTWKATNPYVAIAETDSDTRYE